ncbi:MAG: hypothetical protein JO233_06080, partial [Candidatus Eremiobacteraeota bacterium]|nr:hypothetical protein [Candidatus Eremiobacteraeota bacterium]
MQLAAGNWAGLVRTSNQTIYFVLQFTPDAGGLLRGTIRFPLESEQAQALSRVDLRGSAIHIEATADGMPLVLTGNVMELAIRAKYQLGRADGLTTLLPLRTMSRSQLLPYTGDYADNNGDSVVVAESLGALYYFDRRSGRTGRLYPLQAGHFFGGPTWLIFQPPVVRADFAAFTAGKARNLNFRLNGRALQLRRQSIATDADVRFPAPGATIAGTLRVPLGQGPFPAMLLIAGSNGQ